MKKGGRMEGRRGWEENEESGWKRGKVGGEGGGGREGVLIGLLF